MAAAKLDLPLDWIEQRIPLARKVLSGVWLEFKVSPGVEAQTIPAFARRWRPRHDQQ